MRRRGLLAYYVKEQSLLTEELTKREQQLESAHSMLLRHHQQTQDLEYRQQRSIHALKEEQVQLTCCFCCCGPETPRGSHSALCNI